METGELGFWWRSLGGPAPAGPPLTGPLEADVAIVGAGYTGLWSAYYLKRAAPELRVVVLERETAGFGASGRNGGWVSGFFSGGARTYERLAGGPALLALQRAMFETVDEVGWFLREEGGEADYLKSGWLEVALTDAQAERQRESLRGARGRGLDERDVRMLTREELGERVAVARGRSAIFSPHVARVQPAKLIRALVAAVRGLGVELYERTPVSEIRPHAAVTPAGEVGARWVLRATEGYTASLRGLRRALVPMNSSMIITRPLPESAWAEIGWGGSEVMSDGAHVYGYLQRTADGRIAIGGRGVPYRFASRTDGRGATAGSTVRALRGRLEGMFPAATGVEVDHAWSGVLGVPRDWCPSVWADPDSGLAAAGGYVGEGVAAANLAARSVCDLLLGRPSALTAMPWVGHTPRRWEPEPLRWVGIRGMYGLYRASDRLEQRSGRPSRLGAVLDVVSGRA